MKKTLFTLLCAVMGLAAAAQSIVSPESVLRLDFGLDGNGTPVYELHRGEKTVLKPSKLGIEVRGGRHFTAGFEVDTVVYTSFDQTWEPVWGEVDRIRDRYNEMAVTLYQKSTDRKMVLRFRLYDDGLGFRYEFPYQKKLSYFVITDEKTQFALTGDHMACWVPGDAYTQSIPLIRRVCRRFVLQLLV